MQNKLFRTLVTIFMILFVVVSGLTIYNSNTKKKAIQTATATVGEAFQANVEYSKALNRIIVKKHFNNESELYELTQDVLPKLSIIGEYDIVDLLSFRGYYKDTKEDFQFYDIKFKDISKLNWNEINNFEDFLSYLNIVIGTH